MGRAERTYGVKEEKPFKIMEVCGTHTMAVAKYGIKQLLPEKIKLISGPGCPVCVTPPEDIDKIIELCRRGAIIATFGDLVRVPGTASSLAREKAEGGRVKVVYSPVQALEWAMQNPGEQVVFAGIGFETTAPAVALSVIHARREKVKNYSVLCLHKIMPPAIRYLLEERAEVGAFILPGHVCAITGTGPFEFIAGEYGVSGVVSGFEAADILESIAIIMKNRTSPSVKIQYKRAVKPEGNRTALGIMEEVFEVRDASWRGLGMIRDSGLMLKKDWEEFDAEKRWDLPKDPGQWEDSRFVQKGCRCGEVLKGIMEPRECPLFSKTCRPESPVGPCMVSSEGSCAACYRYGG